MGRRRQDLLRRLLLSFERKVDGDRRMAVACSSLGVSAVCLTLRPLSPAVSALRPSLTPACSKVLSPASLHEMFQSCAYCPQNMHDDVLPTAFDHSFFFTLLLTCPHLSLPKPVALLCARRISFPSEFLALSITIIPWQKITFHLVTSSVTLGSF